MPRVKFVSKKTTPNPALRNDASIVEEEETEVSQSSQVDTELQEINPRNSAQNFMKRRMGVMFAGSEKRKHLFRYK